MSAYRISASRPFHQRGVTLVELMVALVLGLVVSGAALALFMTNKQVYTTSENLDRVQETSRTAFELMARDLREANGIPCSKEIDLSNGLKDYNAAGHRWWTDWGAGIKGYTGTQAFADKPFGTAEGDRVAGTPAIEAWSALPTDIVLTTAMVLVSDPLTVTTTTGKVAANDILVICDYNHGAIFQASKVTANSIEHAAGGTPGNSTGDLPPSVFGPSGVKPDNYAYISKMHASRWYIGYNGRTDRSGNKLTSLYRTSFTGTGIDPVPDEIAEGVVGMTLNYHVDGAQTYVDPAVTPVGDWSKVDAVQVGLSLASRDKVGTDKQTLKRDYDHVVALRSRAP
jgi:type IV pilus assembly protein PilW